MIVDSDRNASLDRFDYTKLSPEHPVLAAIALLAGQAIGVLKQSPEDSSIYRADSEADLTRLAIALFHVLRQEAQQVALSRAA